LPERLAAGCQFMTNFNESVLPAVIRGPRSENPESIVRLEILLSAPIEHENLTRRVVRYEHDGTAAAPPSRLRDNCPHGYKVDDLLTIHPLVALSGNHSVH
jgi:hypothetical protein